MVRKKKNLRQDIFPENKSYCLHNFKSVLKWMIINECLHIFHWKTGQKYWEKL